MNTLLLLAALLGDPEPARCWNQQLRQWEMCSVEQLKERQVVVEKEVEEAVEAATDPSDFTITIGGGYSMTATGTKTSHEPAVDLAVGFDLSNSGMAPRLELFGRFGALPGLGESGLTESFGGFGVDGVFSVPIAKDLFFRPAVLIGFDTRLNGDEQPLHRSARFAYGGVRFARKDRGGLFIGMGGDERLSTSDRETPDYLPAGILSWRLRIGDVIGQAVDLAFVGRVLLYLRLGYGATTAGADSVTLNMLAGWGNK